MLLISFLRVLRFAWQGFWRNFWLSVITVSVLVLIFLTVNFLIVLNVLSKTAVASIQNRVDVSIYFHAGVEDQKIDEVKEFLKTHPQVKEIEVVSAQKALQDFRLRHQNDPTILESLEELGENPLGATIILKAEQVEGYETLSSVIENSKYTDLILDKNFDDNKRFIASINDISTQINRIGIMITSFFAFIAIVVMFNTIRVAIYTHREEIGIMKLVGARNGFISSPFMVESILYGIVACLLSIIITYPLLDFIQPFVSDFFKETHTDIIVFFNQNFISIFGLELAGITALTMLSCSIAIQRYLRV